MNELYNETIERNGKTYHYDPDMDIYYSWIVTIALLSAVCIYIEYFR